MLASAAAPAGHTDGARGFVSKLYSHYPVAGHVPEFDPLGKAMGSVFDPSLIALILKDRELAKGEVGALDGDPLCDCQDDSGLQFKVASVTPDGPERAKAVITRRDPEASPPEAEKITVDLVRVGGRWRVHDIGTPDTPSLRAYLIKSNQEAADTPGE